MAAVIFIVRIKSAVHESIPICCSFHIILHCSAQDNYKIQVQLHADVNGKVFLRYFTPNGPYIDPVNIEQGKCIMIGKMSSETKIAKTTLAEWR